VGPRSGKASRYGGPAPDFTFAFVSYLHRRSKISLMISADAIGEPFALHEGMIADCRKWAMKKTEAMKSGAATTNPPVILLVEDETAVREVTREVLLHAGYGVLESSNAREALQLAGAHVDQIDLLLTDIIMPEMNGAELASQLQAKRPGLVTVFMSGYAESDLARRINQSSATHIQKPFTVHQLLSRVREALQAGAAAGSRKDGAPGYDPEAEQEFVQNPAGGRIAGGRPAHLL
jgi:CheY-like chemotaxis protein